MDQQFQIVNFTNPTVTRLTNERIKGKKIAEMEMEMEVPFHQRRRSEEERAKRIDQLKKCMKMKNESGFGGELEEKLGKIFRG